MSPVDLVLDRLAEYRLRPNGADRWRACCPAHGGSNTSALSVGVGASGAVLLRCWSGCALEAITAALGLDVLDLFPPRDSSAGPMRRRRMLTARQALDLLLAETLVVFVIASDMRAKREVSATDWDRLGVAVARIQGLGLETYA